MPRPKIHMLFSQKGGVGKTTLAVNLAATTASVLGGSPEECPVLVASIDPQASAVWWAERGDEELLPFDFDQIPEDADAVAQLKDAEYAHVFVDCPGSLARPAVLARVLEIADDVVVPTIPEFLGYQPTERTVRDFIQPRGLPYRVVPNLWDPRDGHTEVDALTTWCDSIGLAHTKTVIRRYKMHATAAESGLVVTQHPAFVACVNVRWLGRPARSTGTPTAAR